MTLEELLELQEKVLAERAARPQGLRVCEAASCASLGAGELRAALEEGVRAAGHGERCAVRSVGCLGLCSAGPLVAFDDGPEQRALYAHVTVQDVPDLVAGLAVEGLAGKPPARLALPPDLPFFARQERVVLENAGLIDPEKLEDYVSRGGYQALLRALQGTPAEVLETVSRSGLRGRGGAGYPTGLKWSTVARAEGERKYVVCNADEGDPGAYMDRSVLESDPHRVLEGMAIAAYAVGATRGYVYVRAEYPLAVARLKTALRQAERAGLLGQVGGTAFSFQVELRLGAGAFVCGEETALIASIEGGRGVPRPRPPYPAERGLWGMPTLINNVETFANIPAIFRRGPEWFAGLGTGRSKGTKVFALAGKIRHTGLIEVPMGTRLRDIVFDIGGGVPGSAGAPGRFKAVQTGGPSGGAIPEEHLGTPVDYESLMELGSFMGSGGMIVADAGACAVDLARYFMEFSMSESCGKCLPCRVGTVQLHALLDRVCHFEATLDDLAALEELGALVRDTSLCGLGQGAPNPVFSTLRYFRDEYLAHVLEGRCPAGVCQGRVPPPRADARGLEVSV